jgi:hypothetical protein
MARILAWPPTRSPERRELAVKFDHEVVTERDQKQNAEAAAEEGDDDDLEHGRLGDPGARLRGQHVKRRDGENRARHHV